MARQKNISNSKPIEKVDGIYSSLMELDRDIKVEKEKNSAIKQSPIRQSLMAAEKSNFQEGGVSSLEGDLISKVVMERNKDKDFVKRAYALGENPGTPIFNAFEPNEFGQTMSHKMAWGEDDKGQAYMFPTVMNPKNEAIKVPNQYADYISNEGYKRATGMIPEESFQDGGVIVDSEGQYSHPGKNTLIPDAEGRITMKDVKTPVLGIDDQGNSTIMQPEEEYQFQGNDVLEIPITGDIDSLVDPTRIKAFKKLFSK